MVYFEIGNRSFWNIYIYFIRFTPCRWFYKDIRMCVMHLYINDVLIEQTMVSIFAMCQSLADDNNTYNQLSINCFWFIVFIYLFYYYFLQITHQTRYKILYAECKHQEVGWETWHSTLFLPTSSFEKILSQTSQEFFINWCPIIEPT